MKKRIKPRAYRAVAWRIAILTLALWLAGVSILTVCVANHALTQIETQTWDYAYASSRWAEPDEYDLPGTLERNKIITMGSGQQLIKLDSLLPGIYEPWLKMPISSDDWLYEQGELNYGFEVAVSHYDETGEPMIRTGNYLTFSYTTSEKWAEHDTSSIGYGYVALDDLTDADALIERMVTNGSQYSPAAGMIYPLIWMRGYFEGNEFHPVTVDYGMYTDPGTGFVSDLPTLAIRDGQRKVEWTNVLDIPADPDQELVSIYAWDMGSVGCHRNSVSSNGEDFDSLVELLDRAVSSEDTQAYAKNSLTDTILIEHFSSENYTTAVAVRCKPLQYAVLRLLHVYAISLAVTALALYLILRRIRKHLADPIENLVCSADIGTPVTPGAHYAEIYTLETHFAETHQTLAENKAELQQLRTALDYAHDAEEKRKQLISNITHELKTPLAIIHSYAESLQEDMSAETRAKYLDTMLEETERMDSMVVQMLDLSRLEAGKIRLSTDQFSLLELTKAITERMMPLFEERKLNVIFDPCQDFTVTADEGRISQVITNLLTNAQKYATEGGEVRIRIDLIQSSAYFYVNNSAQHLSDEALEKVWDSFYRVDESRSTAGVGLGLSLVKSIITLHGGTCFVRNTVLETGEDGVEFGFILPLK